MKKFFFSFFLSLFFSSLLADVTLSSGTSFSSDQRWSAANKLIIDATLTTSSTSPGGVTSFPCNADQSLVVNNSYTYTIQNMFLKYLSPDHISLGTGSSIIFDSGSTIFFLKNETLNYTWKFGASSTLDGNNKTLTLGSSGILEVQAGGSLTLKDLTIYDVNGTNVRCADNTGTITFDNVKIVNRNSWSFQNGAFAVKNTLAMTGGGKFAYQSAYASTINDNSTLFLTDGMTFSYDPAKGSGQAVAGQQNLVFTNTSSKLWCDGVTLKITNTGMRLTKGTLQFDRFSSVYVDAATTNMARALILGDGDYRNDPQINFGPDAKVSLETGGIQYELAEDNTIKVGDRIMLKNTLYGFYLQTSTAEIGGHIFDLLGSFVRSLETSWQFSQAIGQSAASFIGYYNYGFQGGHLNLRNSYSFWNSPATVSSPFPPYARATAAAQGDQSYIIQNSGGRTDLRYGDVVSFPVKNLSNFVVGYLGSSNLDYGIYKEIYFYAPGTDTPPPNNSHLWLVEKY